MVKIGKINELTVYEDKYMSENTILTGVNFIIISPNTSKIIYKELLKNMRKEKLENLK